jgi:hypothetical protein
MDDAETANPGVTVPDDFPRDPFPAALSGAQPKVAARLIDGEYVVGLTENERRGRYLMCHDLVEQLTEYAERKRTERTDLTLPALLDAIDISVRKKGWEVAGIELDWIMGRVRARFL